MTYRLSRHPETTVATTMCRAFDASHVGSAFRTIRRAPRSFIDLRSAPLILALLAFSHTFTRDLAAQTTVPTIAYIIPDIGVPGMNTYVEIVAPVDSIDSFSPARGNGNGMPSIGEVEVELVNKADSARLITSPVILSWDGRLISCQFFVRPGAAAGPVPIRVRVNGRPSNTDTFRIEAAPQTMPVNPNGGVLGAGTLGRRSRRGAMIVDSLVLGPGRYDIDLGDPDPRTPGNQGYLPFILISKGPVRIAPGAIITASAEKKNGGPGGGGGGGYGEGLRVGPVTIEMENDPPTGSGFTAGNSHFPLVPPPAAGIGEGSGRNGISLNGVDIRNEYAIPGSGSTFIYGYAGGPGHPFDRSGVSGGATVLSLNGATLSTGFRHGGGGNASVGNNTFPADELILMGQIVGNREIVPLHGGGGGAGGGYYDSIGAGGGGGIAIHSHRQTIVPSIESRGADGANGRQGLNLGNGEGAAGGAGGSVIVGGKLGIAVSTVDVQGGVAGQNTPRASNPPFMSGDGGVGRFRGDGTPTATTTVTPGASQYIGPTTDTLSVTAQRLIKLRGTGRPSTGAPSIRIYVRGEDGAWPLAPIVATTLADGRWEADIPLPNDTLFYVFAAQVTPVSEQGSASDTATRVPLFVTSQTAANIIRIQPEPVYSGPDTIYFETYCTDPIVDTAIVVNRGGAPLLLATESSIINGPTPAFRLPNASFPVRLPAGGVRPIPIEFDPNEVTDGRTIGRLQIVTDEGAAGRTVHEIVLVADKGSLASIIGATPSVIDFGDVPVGSTINRPAVLAHVGLPGAPSLTFDSIWMKPPRPSVKLVIVPTLGDTVLAPGTQLEITAQFSPTAEEDLDGMEFCVRLVEPCDTVICWTLRGRGVRSAIGISKPDLSMTASGCDPPLPAYDTLLVFNRGSAPLTIDDLPLDDGAFALVEPTTLPATILPNDTVRIVVRYTPDGRTDVAGNLTIESDDAGTPSLPVAITATKILIETGTVAPSPVNFGDVPVGGIGPANATLNNTGTRDVWAVDAQIVPATPGISIVPGQFPLRIPAGGSAAVALAFNPPAAGFIPAGVQLDVATLVDSLCPDTLHATISGNGVTGNLLASPNPVDLGGVLSCLSDSATVEISMSSGGSKTFAGGTIDGTSARNFSWRWMGAANPTVTTGAPALIMVTYTPTLGPDGPQTATLTLWTVEGDTVSVVLRGVRFSEAVTYGGPTTVTAQIGGAVTVTRTITNTATATIAINDVRVASPFRIVAMRPRPPLFLAPGATMEIDVEFAPKEDRTFTEDLVIEAVTFCGPFPTLSITGEPAPLVPIAVRWDDVTGKPGEIVRLPILLEHDVTGMEITSYTLDATFNRTMLEPLRVVLGGTLSDGWSVGNAVYGAGSFSFSATGTTPLAGMGTLAVVEALVLLGDDVTTPIAPDTLSRFETGAGTMAPSPGLFTLEGYCTVGSNRLIRVTDEFGIKSVAPNPASGRIAVDLELVEEGTTSLAIYDALGRRVALLASGPMSAQPYAVEADVSELGAGLYFIELRTPTQVDRMGIVVR